MADDFSFCGNGVNKSLYVEGNIFVAEDIGSSADEDGYQSTDDQQRHDPACCCTVAIFGFVECKLGDTKHVHGSKQFLHLV